MNLPMMYAGSIPVRSTMRAVLVQQYYGDAVASAPGSIPGIGSNLPSLSRKRRRYPIAPSRYLLGASGQGGFNLRSSDAESLGIYSRPAVWQWEERPGPQF